MRELTCHKVNPANDLLKVEALDGPGPGGASHAYDIQGFDATNNPSNTFAEYICRTFIIFQNGPINEVGVNGITHEVLIAILLDRLDAFQSGPYANEFNRIAAFYLRGAQDALYARTMERMSRNVEGTHQP